MALSILKTSHSAHILKHTGMNLGPLAHYWYILTVKFGDLLLFYSDIINVEYNLHQCRTEKVYNSRTTSPGHSCGR